MSDPVAAPMVVDAHHHYWTLALQEQSWRTHEHESIARDYGPSDLAPELASVGVDATVLVQSVDDSAENDRLASYADRTDSVAGVVGWLPLDRPDEARLELDRASTPSWRGVRCLVGRRRLDWLARADVVDLFRELAGRKLAWDVVPVTAEQVTAVETLASTVPQLGIIVDHLARPPAETAGWSPWAEQIARLAAIPSVSIKLSVGIDVLTAWGRWDPSELGRYVDHVLGCFGPHRVMLASNWPVVLLRAPYGQVWRDLTGLAAVAGLTEAELREVTGGSAVRAYSLARR